ncbi:MAG: Rpn family recombination-promoting nuclease/putative transposase [Thermoguttaceae bacterium]|nr:Rpn family recombination-promoting nuclease/putative transposase [Thermoguttaceae bacterium]
MSDSDNNPSETNSGDFSQSNGGNNLLSLDDMTAVYHINHDTFFQLVFALPEVAIAFLKNVLPSETLEQIEPEKVIIQSGVLGESDYFKKSAADLIYLVPYKEIDEKLHVSVILEHKSYSDRMTMFQLTKYCFHVMERELDNVEKEGKKTREFRFSPIIPIIIHHGESAFYEPTDLKNLFIPLAGSEQFGINAKAILFDLNKIDISNLKYGTNVPEFFSVLKMMQATFSRHGALEGSEALAALRPYSKNPKYWKLIRALIIYMGKCSKHVSAKEYNQIIFDDNIVDQGEEKMSSLLDYWTEKGIEQGKELGIEQGKELGIEQGKELGILKTLKSTILQTLNVRFGAVPSTVQDVINNKSDKVILQSLFETALQTQSLDDFIKEL